MNILIIVLAKKSIIIIIIINLSMKQRKMRLYTNRHKLRLSEPIHSEHKKNTRKKSCSPIAENNNYSCYSHQSFFFRNALFNFFKKSIKNILKL